MSLPLQLTTPFLHRHNIPHDTKPTFTIASFSRAFHQASCVHKQFLYTNRRNTLVGLILLPTLTTNHSSMAAESSAVGEFGTEPRQLNDTIRVVVSRPKACENAFSKEETVEVLKVEGIEINNNEPVRFDVYVAKLDGDKVGADLGELAGSLIEDARYRMGRMARSRGLNLGITNLVKRIGGEDCEKLVVSLVPTMGELSIGGVRIDHIQAC
ncbi:catechol oxidase [Ranunculus cassubicifolius]